MQRSWIDISVPVRPGMPQWPGDPPVEVERVQDQAKGDEATVSRLSMSVHAGTHLDAPLHYFEGQASIETLPLDATVGPARVLGIGSDDPVRPEDLERFGIQPGERVLLRTRNSDHVWKTDSFVEDFVFLTPAAARYLAERRPRCVGVDYLSVGGFGPDGARTHQALLGAGVWIIEGLDLSGVEPGTYDLVCLPLRLRDAEGAPARAALAPRTEAES